MSTMLKATFRCMKQSWVHPNAKSGIKQNKGERLVDKTSPSPFDFFICVCLGVYSILYAHLNGEVAIVRFEGDGNDRLLGDVGD